MGFRKIVLVHDYLKEFGGAERVLLALHEMYPQAPIYTLFSISNSPATMALGKTRIVKSWFGYLPFCDRLISPLRFLLPLMWAGFNFDSYDLIISSASWAVTKGFTNGENKEICYCHTPPRYLYGYETSRNWKKHWYIRSYATIVNHFLRLYDFLRAQKVTTFVANSLETQARIKKFYRRESVIINPPVELPHVAGQVKENFFLAGGRLVLPKNFDLIVKASEKLGVPLRIYGWGPEEGYLRSISGKNVEFLGLISEEGKFSLMSRARAFIAAATDEDFGITVVEAMAAGTPVVAYKGGGYLETVTEKTGVFFGKYNVESLVEAMQKISKMKFKKEDLQEQAKKFSKENFVKKMREIVYG